MKPVLYRYRDSESVIRAMDGYTPGEGWEPLYDRAALDAAVSDALDRSVKACRNVAAKQPTLGRQFAAIDCAETIFTLKGKP